MKIDPQINAASAQRLVGLAPLVSDRTRLLILGSFPGVASLAAQQYYAHPQNQFWAILTAIFACSPSPVCKISYEKCSNWLLEQGLGVWDVYASCERAGSLDSAIRNAQVNDFASLAQRCPNLDAIAHNGGESFKHAKRVIPIRIKNDNCVASPCRAAALSAASRLVLLSNANWNYLELERRRAAPRREGRLGGQRSTRSGKRGGDTPSGLQAAVN